MSGWCSYQKRNAGNGVLEACVAGERESRMPAEGKAFQFQSHWFSVERGERERDSQERNIRLHYSFTLFLCFFFLRGLLRDQILWQTGIALQFMILSHLQPGE